MDSSELAEMVSVAWKRQWLRNQLATKALRAASSILRHEIALLGAFDTRLRVPSAFMTRAQQEPTSKTFTRIAIARAPGDGASSWSVTRYRHAASSLAREQRL